MSADVLREASIQLRDAVAEHEQVATDARVRGVWLNSRYQMTLEPAVAIALSDWLAAQADVWETNFRATQSPSLGVDDPPGVHYRDPEGAARSADYHVRHALAVARAYLKDLS